jgi:hypothetical protein
MPDEGVKEYIQRFGREPFFQNSSWKNSETVEQPLHRTEKSVVRKGGNGSSLGQYLMAGFRNVGIKNSNFIRR